MPDLETERLVLRRLQPDDLGVLSRLHASGRRSARRAALDRMTSPGLRNHGGSVAR